MPAGLRSGVGTLKAVRIGINGFGRMGRLAFRAAFGRADLSVVHVNEMAGGAATAQIYPELKGKLNGLAVRVPLLNASLTDCVFEVARPTSTEEVNTLLQQASHGELRGILGFEERPLVSVDFRGDPRSAVIDALSTLVVDETQVKILAWYDNEWGYVNRMVELAAKVAGSLPPVGR
jgi:glyceraldehyde 3-phosphate dehydrogenase